MIPSVEACSLVVVCVVSSQPNTATALYCIAVVGCRRRSQLGIAR